MIALLRDKQGATSVLVVFMMVVLVVFATLAFTTSYANYRLSQRTQVVTGETYALENAATDVILAVDTCLADAEARVQREIQQQPITDATQMAADMGRLYLQYAAEGLAELAGQTPGMEIEQGDFGATPAEDDLTLSITLTAGSEPGNKQLDVKLAVLPLRYTLAIQGEAVSGAREEDFIRRYAVKTWKQWQIPFTYDDGLEFGDATQILED